MERHSFRIAALYNISYLIGKVFQLQDLEDVDYLDKS